MERKGMVFGTIIGIIIGAVIIIVLLLALFIGPQNLYEKVKDMIPRADIYLPHGGGETPDQTSRSTQEQATAAFNELAKGYTRLANDTANACFYFFESGGYDKLWPDYEIEISETREGTALYLNHKLEEANENNPVVSTVLSVTVPDVKPCVVYGTTQASSFYNHYIERSESQSYNKYVNPQTTIRLRDEHILFGNQKEEWETVDEGDYVLYRAGDHICLFPTKGGGILGYALCDGDDGKLDDDCFDKDADDSIYEAVRRQREPLWKEAVGRCDPSTPGGISANTG